MYTKILLHLEALSPLIIPSLCIVLIAALLAILLKRKLVETIFLSNSTIIVTLFLTGILNFKGSLLIGYGIIIALASFSLVFLLRSYFKNKDSIKELSPIQGLLLFVLFLLIALYLNYGQMFIVWDEFSHWGSVLKYMYNLNALGSIKEAGVLIPSYCPASSIFQYFWMRPFSVFTEYPAYIASNMFFFSLVMMFIKKFNSKTVLFLITALLIPIAIPFLPRYHFFNSLYVDSILGILLGFMLLVHYNQENKRESYKIITISAISIILTLTKDTGIIFALIGNVIILLDYLLFKSRFWKRNKDKKYKFSKNFRNLRNIISPFLATILAKLLWWGHLKLVKVPQLLKGIETRILIDGELLPYQQETFLNFKNALIEKQLIAIGLSVVEILFILSIIFIILNLTLNKKVVLIKRLLFAFITMILGAVGYFSSILIAYMFIFGNIEAVALASYERYILSYIIAMVFFFLIFLLLNNPISPKVKIRETSFIINLKAVLSILLIFSIYYFLINNAIKESRTRLPRIRKAVQERIYVRGLYDGILVWEEALSDPDDRICLIAQNTVGFETLALIHTVAPTRIKWTRDYSVGLEPYYTDPDYGDPWTMIISPEDWAQYIIDNYDLLYIYHYDEKFENTYGKYFDKVEDNALYEVTVNNQNALELKSVPKS